MVDNAGQGYEDEFYEDATEEFASVKDLIPGANNMIKGQVDGRLVAIWAGKNGTRVNDRNETYGFTESLVFVLDDGQDGSQATDLVGPAPVEVMLQLSTGGLYSRLSPRVDGMTKARRDADGNVVAPSVPQKWRPMIGRINARPSTKMKNGSPSIGISAPTESDREIVNRYRAQIVEINQRMEAKDAAVADAAAFE